MNIFFEVFGRRRQRVTNNFFGALAVKRSSACRLLL